jgi:hypothetical protein
LREPEAARTFDARFERMWADAKPLPAPGNFLARAGHPSRARSDTAATPPGCVIKGNVSRNGARICHVPGDWTYDRVQMDEGHDKRWFCTEEQVVAAGWIKAAAR